MPQRMQTPCSYVHFSLLYSALMRRGIGKNLRRRVQAVSSSGPTPRDLGCVGQRLQGRSTANAGGNGAGKPLHVSLCMCLVLEPADTSPLTTTTTSQQLSPVAGATLLASACRECSYGCYVTDGQEDTEKGERGAICMTWSSEKST